MFNNLATQKKALLSLFFVFAFLFTAIAPATAVFAEDASGTPGQKPMYYIGSYLTTISSNTSTTGADITTASVSAKPLIKVVVDKNVVNDEVWTNNQKCVTLQNSAGVDVPATISRIPDTANFSERQNIFITPAYNLAPGGKYKIVISPELKAKNGFSTLGMTTNNQPVVVNFTVAGTASTAASQVIYYVKSGDTLSKIAQIYGLTSYDLITANNLNASSYLYVGQAIVIPTVAHVVQSGDTFYKIALKYGSTSNAIITANKLSYSSSLYVGQKLFVPVNLYVYTVKSGDTLSLIAQKCGTTSANIVRLNNLDTSKWLYVGQKLKVNY